MSDESVEGFMGDANPNADSDLGVPLQDEWEGNDVPLADIWDTPPEHLLPAGRNLLQLAGVLTGKTKKDEPKINLRFVAPNDEEASPLWFQLVGLRQDDTPGGRRMKVRNMQDITSVFDIPREAAATLGSLKTALEAHIGDQVWCVTTIKTSEQHEDQANIKKFERRVL